MRRRPAPSADRTASSRARAVVARQQQVGHVGAAHQQDEADDAEQQQRRQPQLRPDERVAQRLEHDAVPPVSSRKLRAAFRAR